MTSFNLQIPTERGIEIAKITPILIIFPPKKNYQ